MEIVFNILGILTDVSTASGEFRQGSVGNRINVTCQGRNNQNYIAKLNFTRPDGQSLSNLIMSISQDSTNGYYYVLDDEWYLAVSGTATATVYVYDGSGNIIANGQVQFSIEETDYHAEPDNITNAQYNTLLALIQHDYLRNIKGFVVLDSLMDDISSYSTNQLFYVKSEKAFYYKSGLGIVRYEFGCLRFLEVDYENDTILDIVNKVGLENPFTFKYSDGANEQVGIASIGVENSQYVVSSWYKEGYQKLSGLSGSNTLAESWDGHFRSYLYTFESSLTDTIKSLYDANESQAFIYEVASRSFLVKIELSGGGQSYTFTMLYIKEPKKYLSGTVSGSTTISQILSDDFYYHEMAEIDYVKSEALHQIVFEKSVNAPYSLVATQKNINGDTLRADTLMQLDDIPNANSSNPITSKGVKAAIDQAVAGAYKPRGSVATYADLPATGNTVGDVYNVLENGANYVWVLEDGVGYWDKLGETINWAAYDEKFMAAGFFEVNNYNESTGEITMTYATDLYGMTYDSNSGILTIEAN